MILSGAGQLDLYNYATTLNSLLKDPLIAQFVSIDLRPILGDLVANLSAQGITFVVADSTEGSGESVSSGVNSSGTLNPNTGASMTASSGLSI